MAVQQESKKQSEKESKKADEEKAELIAKVEQYMDQRDKFTDAMTDKLRHDRYPYNMSEKDLMKLLSYADDDKVFGSKVKASEIRQFLNDRAKDKVLSRPEFRKEGGMVSKKKSKVAGRLALRGYGRAMKGKK
jgi:hypothetical protein